MHLEMAANNRRLGTSPDLRKAMRSLIVSFQADLWDDVSDSEEFERNIPVLVRAIYSNIDGKGTHDTLNTMRDACTPTDWLVIGLTTRKASATDATLIEFIQTVLDKLNTIYTLLCSVDMHYKWELKQNACISSLLTQLKSAAI
jgi:hypothetical protein